MTTEPTAIHASVTFYEVISTPQPPRTGHAFGVIFTDPAEASRYARAMRRAGFAAKVSPDFASYPTAQIALADAARYYDAPELEAAQ